MDYYRQMKSAMANLRLIVEEDHRDIKPKNVEVSEEVRRCELKRFMSICEEEMTSIRSQATKADEVDGHFSEYVRSLSDEDKEEQSKIIAQFEQLMNNDLCYRAQVRLRQLSKAKHELASEYDKLSCALGYIDNRATTRPQIRAESIQLPTIHFEKFSGDRMRWPEFFENFNAAVNNSSMPNIQKLTYLRNLLVGEAKSVIEGLELSGNNYAIALELLRSRYDNKEERIRELYHRLSSLKVCRTFEECKEFSTKLECICRQLEAAGEDVESKQMYLSLEQKLSKPMLREMLREKELGIVWNTASFRKKLKELIIREDAFQRVSSIHHVEPQKFQRSQPGNVQRDVRRFQPQHQSLAFAAPARDTIPACPKTLFQRPNKVHENGQVSSLSQQKYGKPKCPLCHYDHEPEACSKYKTVEERKERIKAEGLCFKCLSGEHPIRLCQVQKGCRFCGKPHHSALCWAKQGRSVEPEVSTTATAPSSAGKVLLMTASAVVRNPERALQQEVTLFFDTGSHRSFVTREVVQQLKLNIHGTEKLSLCTFGATQPRDYVSSKVKATIQAKEGVQIPVQLNVVDDIIPKPVPMAIINSSQRIRFDPEGQLVDKFIVNKNPGILIGIDHMHQFKITTVKELECGYVISNSVLGRIISGKARKMEGQLEQERQELSLLTVDIVNEKKSKEDQLFNLVQGHFDLEKAGIEEDRVEDEESMILDSFNKSLRIVDGRYEVTLPWKEKDPQLNSNYGLASGRLRSAMRTLQRRPELLEQYNKTMKEQLEKGIIELVPKESPDKASIIHYLPHQPVIREDKQHTKLRIVYDGSAKMGKNSRSINQCLHRGPLLLCDLVGIILRFRIPKICIVADIEKAFLQMSVAPRDRDACRFLWPADPQSPNWHQQIDTYRFRRVTFGLICSPFLLAATVKEHLRRDGSELARNILKNIYVDNVVIHADSSEETLQLCQRAKDMFKSVSMNLREFASNDRQSISKLKDEDKTPSAELKMLGLKWDTDRDVFIMKLKVESDDRPTKRSVLKQIAGVFDPMGWIAPAMLSSKKFFQRTWKHKVEWDAELPEVERKEWRRIVETWNHSITIPRRLFQQQGSLQLHVFSDASNEAFGVAAYLSLQSSTEPGARLIFAKSRVKPKNSTATIPKLELQALTLAAQVARFLQGQLVVEKTQLWTDSQCVIHWLNSTSKMERYIENRVKKIREFNVNYVNTAENPADLVTRGLTFEELEKCELWWTGPKWLGGEEPTGSESSPSFDPIQFESREKSEEIFHVTSTPVAEQRGESIIDLCKFSTLKKAIRITAFMLRFIDKSRKRSKEKSTITSDELQSGRKILILEAQKRNPPSDEAKRSMEMVQDADGIWKCRGRIGQSQLSQETQTPIWLPRGDRLTTLIILDAHQKTFHSGSTTTLAQVRKEFWVPQGRKKVHTTVRQECMACRRWLARPYKLPNMPDLPEERVKRCRPFENTGLDYFGPMSVRQTKQSEAVKTWVCIFTCLVTRAVHLEVVQDLSAETFIAAFRRFISRRGTPKIVMSDNGTNFKLAEKLIVEKWKDVLTVKSTQDIVAEHGIKWKFIAERAPWRGGFWERLIGIVKNALKRTLGRRILDLVEFQTFITEIEMIINQRPLTYQSETEPIRALRPIDFLIPYETVSDSPKVDLEDNGDPEYRDHNTKRDQLTDEFDKVMRRVETFWRRWHEEYLTSLRERQNSLAFKQGPTARTFPVEGEVVLVQENDSPRSNWRIAIVKELIPGRDGEVRTARIRSGTRETSRALNVLFPLEIGAQEKEEVPEIVQMCGAIILMNPEDAIRQKSKMDDYYISPLGASEDDFVNQGSETQQITMVIDTPLDEIQDRGATRRVAGKTSSEKIESKRQRSENGSGKQDGSTFKFRPKETSDTIFKSSSKLPSRTINFSSKTGFGPNSYQGKVRNERKNGSAFSPRPSNRSAFMPAQKQRSAFMPKQPVEEEHRCQEARLLSDRASGRLLAVGSVAAPRVISNRI